MQITEPNRFIECVIAPGFSDAAFQLLTTRPTLEEERAPAAHRAAGRRRRDGARRSTSAASTAACWCRAATCRRPTISRTLKVVTKRPPTAAELADLRFAWLVCKHVKSNAIVLAKDGMVVGVGAGQMSRVDSVHMAVRKAGERARGRCWRRTPSSRSATTSTRRRRRA